MRNAIMKRRWFQDKDGTYYRNCPLIMNERRELLNHLRGTNPWRLRKIKRLNQALGELQREWQTTWVSILRKKELGPDDVVVTAGRFRDVYPDKPGLWFLDDPEWPRGDEWR